MNFVAQVEEHLRDLGSEARKKHPGVKEASERAILQLRSLQNRYVVAVRRATSSSSYPHPTTALFRSQDVLRPFLLAANYPDVSYKLLTIALNAIQLLINKDAVCRGDGLHVVRVLSIQANVCSCALSTAGLDGKGVIGSTLTGITGFLGKGSSQSMSSTNHGSISSIMEDGYSSSSGQPGHHSHRSLKEDETLSIRVLQTLTMIADSRSLDLTEEVLCQSFSVCWVLISAVRGNVFGFEGSAITSSSKSNKGKSGTVTGGASISGTEIVSGTGSMSSARKVRRAATATLRQIISILFDRAATTYSKNISDQDKVKVFRKGGLVYDENDEYSVSTCTSIASESDAAHASVVRNAAARTFLDICTCADYHATEEVTSRGGKKGPASFPGPFLQGLTGSGNSHHGRVQAPPRSVCFDLLDMILRQRVDLFTAQSDDTNGSHSSNENDGASKEATHNKGSDFDFPSLLRNHCCPLLTKTLMSDFAAGRIAGVGASMQEQSATRRQRRIRDTPTSFALLMRSTQLASSIVTLYGVDHHVKLIDIHAECQVLVKCLVKFVTIATEGYRDSDYFEDGFVYNVTDDTQGLPSNSSAAGGVFTRKVKRMSQSQLVSPLTLWRAALALESLRGLVTDHFSTLVILNDTSDSARPNETLLSIIAEAISDFATIAASCKDGIMQVVNTASQIGVIKSVIAESSNNNTAQESDPKAPTLERSTKQSETISVQSSAAGVLSSVIQPSLFTKAREVIKLYDEWDAIDEMSFSQNMKENDIGSSSSVHAHVAMSGKDDADGSRLLDHGQRNSFVIPPCDIGEAVWMAYNCVLALAASLSAFVTSPEIEKNGPGEAPNKSDVVLEAKKEQIKTLVNSSFAPSLAVLQHFLKRFPGSRSVISCTLSGYVSLSSASIPLTGSHDMHRKAILTSISKLSLPSWGKNDPSCQLQDHHVATLATLFQIVHYNHDYILSDWYIILCTLDQLSSQSIASPRLSDKGYSTALYVAACVSRLSIFTACLSLESVSSFIAGLVSLSDASFNGSGKDNWFNSGFSLDVENEVFTTKVRNEESFGGKLMSFAGRAFSSSLGGGGQEQEFALEYIDPSLYRIGSSTKYSEDFCDKALSKLAATKPSTTKETIQRLSFSLVLLADVTLENSFRFSLCGEAVMTHLSKLAATSESPETRLFAMDTMMHLVTRRLSQGMSGLYFENGPTSIENQVTIETYLTVRRANVLNRSSSSDAAVPANETTQECKMENSLEKMSPAELLAPVCKTITESRYTDTVETGLNSLHVTLEGVGHNMSGKAWIVLIEAISRLSGCYDCESGGTAITDHSTSEWTSCGALAFRCLKLIVDDFLDDLPFALDEAFNGPRASLLDCCASFGSSTHDVNASLTAIGMLWTIADQDPTPSCLDHVLLRLALLAADDRAEVRNCSVNTLFSCVVGLGHRFNGAQWRFCLSEIIFGVFDQVTAKGMTDESEQISPDVDKRNDAKVANRYKVTIHHSRDSLSKQWATTLVLTLRGLERVLRQYFIQLLATADLDRTSDQGAMSVDGSGKDLVYSRGANSWFESAWGTILDLACRCSTQLGGRDTLDIRVVGVDLLVLCVQLSSTAGITATSTPARIGTNMQVVNGALRSVRSPVTNNAEVITKSISLSPTTDETRQRLFCDAFCALERFKVFLDDDKVFLPEDKSQMYYVEPVILQVLTKLSQGLVKLFDCCKDYEMVPQPDSVVFDGNDQLQLVDRFIDIVALVVTRATTGEGSKFLTQAQRNCLELLESMALLSLPKAFVTLANMGGIFFFCRQSTFNKLEGSGNPHSMERLEYEAAKVVAGLFMNEGVPHVSKVHVLCTVLDAFFLYQSKRIAVVDEIDREHTDSSADGNISLELLVPVFDGAFSAIASIEAHQEAKKPDLLAAFGIPLDDVWSKVIDFFSVLSTPLDTFMDCGYFLNTNAILNIISSCVANVPTTKTAELGVALSKRAVSAIEVARFYSGSNIYSEQHVKDGLAVFKSCFEGMCKCRPNDDTLSSIAEDLLENAVNDFAASSDYGEQPLIHVNMDAALAICQSMRNMNAASNLAIKLFPWLCKLVDSNHSELRQEASAVLGSIDLVKIVDRAELAEQLQKNLNEEIGFLKLKNEELELQLAAKNKELNEKFKLLEQEDDERERQEVVLSEGLAYT